LVSRFSGKSLELLPPDVTQSDFVTALPKAPSWISGRLLLFGGRERESRKGGRGGDGKIRQSVERDRRLMLMKEPMHCCCGSIVALICHCQSLSSHYTHQCTYMSSKLSF